MERIFRFITNLFDSFRLNNEKEDFSIISENIDSGVVFKGTNSCLYTVLRADSNARCADRNVIKNFPQHL